jgi:transposase
MAKNSYAVSDEFWEKVRPFIPPRENTHPRGGGRKPKDDRLVFQAIIFVLRLGCQWDALNATGLSPSSTVHDRFQKWVAAGLFHRLYAAGLLQAEPLTRAIDWSWLFTGLPEDGSPPSGQGESRKKTRRPWLKRKRPVPAAGPGKPPPPPDAP